MKLYFLPITGIVLVSLLLFSCGGSSPLPEKKEKLEQGTMNGRVYTNKYFGITVEAPANWYVMSFKPPKKERPYQIDLFQAMEYPPDSAYIDNGNIYIAGEVKNHNPLINDGADYLAELRDGLEMIALEGDQIGEIKPAKVGGKDVYMLETYSNDPDRELETHQKYYATLIKDYWILITLTYYDDEQKASLEKCLAGIKLN